MTLLKEGEEMRKRLLVALIASVFTSLVVAEAQDCDAVLRVATRTVVRESSSAEKLAAFYEMCSMTFTEHQNTYGGKASFEYEMIGGTGEYNQGNYDKFQHQECTTSNRDENRAAAAYYFSSVPDDSVIHDWLGCVTKQKFSCRTEPQSVGDSTIVVVIYNGDPANSLPLVTSSSRDSGTVTAWPSDPNNKKNPAPGPAELIPRLTKLPRGEAQVVVTRDPKIPWTGTLSVVNNGAGSRCSVYAPAQREFLQRCPDVSPEILSSIGCYNLQCPDTFTIASGARYSGSDRVFGSGAQRVYCRMIGNGTKDNPLQRDCMLIDVDATSHACRVSRYFTCEPRPNLSEAQFCDDKRFP